VWYEQTEGAQRLNQNRAPQYPTALLAWLGLILGFSFGLFFDQAANLPFDGNLMPALRACNYCIEAAIPVAAEAIKVNRWTFLGSMVGLLVGVVIAILSRLRPTPPDSQAKRLSSFRQLETENARRSQDVDLRSRRLAVINHIATDLAQARDLASLLQLTLETLMQALGAESASGMIVDGEAARDSTHVLATGRLPAAPTDVPAALELTSNPLLDRLQETGAPLIADAGSRPAEGVVRPEHFAWVGPDVSMALFLPLMADGRLLGAIGLGGRKFSVPDAELGRAIVQQTVTALQYLQLRDRALEQSGVQQLTRAIGRAADFNQLYQAIRLQLAEVAGIQSLSLARYDAARNRVNYPLIVEKGQLVSIADDAGRTPGGLVGHIVQTRQTVRLSGDVAAQAKALGLTLGLPNQHPARGGPEAETAALGKAYLGVPLVLGDKLIGVLVAQDLELADAFDDRTERLLSASSSQIALAIENLHLVATTQSLAGQLQERTEALRLWHERVAGLLNDRTDLSTPVSLAHVLSQELLIGSRALAAEAGAIYLSQAGTGRLASQTEVGLVEKVPAAVAQEGGLVAAAVAAREMIVVDDLMTDPRWGAGPVLQTGPAEGVAAGNGANGAVNSGSNGNANEDSAPSTSTPGALHSAGISNGHYRSGLVVPVVAGEQALGALLFLSARPAAFTADSLPVAQAAANQVAFAVLAASHDHAFRQQVEAMQQWIAVDAPIVEAPVPTAAETNQGLPVISLAIEPGVPQPVVKPGQHMGDEGASPVPPAAWTRLAPPAGALLLVLCLAAAAIANGGALKQAAAGLLGGAAPTATQLAASLATGQPSTVVPTTAPATSTTAPSAVPTASATATARATATPLPTATLLPSASPTVTLPPDVIGLATVVLPEGIAGRLRDAPNGNVIGGVPGNMPVQVLVGRQTTDDNIVWVHIRLTNTGQTGWFSEGLLKYMATPVP
jgi:GAF domain-containing protein